MIIRKTGPGARLALLALGLVLLAALPVFAQAPEKSVDFLNRILDGAIGRSQASSERLSSGRYRLADDPAGYVIYDRMAAAVRGFDRLIANQADMVSYYTVQESALGQVAAILQDIRDLALQKSSPMLGDDDREILDSRIVQLAEEMLRTFRDSEFNTIKILGPFLADPLVAATATDPGRFGLAKVDGLLAFVTRQRTAIGAQVNRLHFSISGDASAGLNTQAAASQGDTEYGDQSANFARDQLLVMANLLLMMK